MCASFPFGDLQRYPVYTAGRTPQGFTHQQRYTKIRIIYDDPNSMIVDVPSQRFLAFSSLVLSSSVLSRFVFVRFSFHEIASVSHIYQEEQLVHIRMSLHIVALRQHSARFSLFAFCHSPSHTHSPHGTRSQIIIPHHNERTHNKCMRHTKGRKQMHTYSVHTRTSLSTSGIFHIHELTRVSIYNH